VRLLDAALSGDPRAVDAVVDSIAPIERHGIRADIRAGIRAWCTPFDRICARLQESEARAS
jgi:hypothetical protein